ncbi:hypothetical protein J3U57_03535 [Gilliamella sp. B3464]|uniref:HAD family hydrolase n=1 Tax=unclassified Gilliamella TaxID=2685620 RepID=UPI00226A7669|nr:MULTISPECIES: hypothetical protein [unclassified Gilliamella]MCX8711451.1 hypothetical protein [Gilliamella sp. B3468]MCX8750648.1 hypothetical protein [Gilliamella sp. B3464]
MLDKVKKLIDTHEIISFDIFDTLLLRIYAKPTDLFLHMEKLYNILGFFKARIAAETNARAHTSAGEITLDEIYQQLPDYFRTFKCKEIEHEIAALKVNKDIYQVYKYALKKKKKIIITSDMYLSKDILINILHKNGYNKYDHFYLSSETLVTKHNGTLYTLILNDLNITAPNTLLHIGDNYYSDYERAIEKGIDAYHYKKAIDQLFESNIRTKMYYDQNPNDVGASILLGLLAYNHLKFDKNYWKNFGYNYAGPTVFSYVYWLKKSFEKDNINNALFVARDGYSLKKVFDLMNDDEVKSSYIYAPRVLSTLFYLDFNQNKYIDPNEKFSAVKNILSHYKERNNILKEKTPNITSTEEGVAFIEQHIDIYKKLAEEETKSYKDYIENLSLKENLAIIDTCSINLSSQRLIEKIIGKQLYGYYFLLQANENTNINLDDYILRAYREDKFSWIKDWDVMEFFMTSPEPPIKDFRNGNPIYKKPDNNDKIRSEIYPVLSQGIVEFAKDLLSSFPNWNPFITWKNIFDWVNIFCSVSTPKDKKMLANVNHAFDFNHEKYVPICKEWYNFEYENKIQTKNKFKIGNLVVFKKLSKKNLSSYFFFNLPILTVNKENKRINYHLFKYIPVYKRKEKKNKMKYYAFNLPILTITKKYYR